ncbi:MAG: DUF222 domain-containing protein [Actinobacteria bacterium]|nr:DUF222 domain-containing protein [Actinomycetota bacterium]
MATDELQALGEALDALLRLDPGSLPDVELHGSVVSLAEARARLEAAEARLLGEWDARKVWAQDGSRSPGARLARETGSSSTDANRRCRRARRLRTMPATAQAFAAGHVGPERVDGLVALNQPGVAGDFAAGEADLVQAATRLAFDDFSRVAAYWKACADDAHTVDRALRRREERCLHLDATLDGTLHVRGTLEGVDGEIVRTELERLEHELWEADWRHARAEHGDDARPEHLVRTSVQRRADALVEMAKRAAAARSAGTTTPPRPLYTVLVDLDTFTSRICETSRGSILAPELLADRLFDAEVERVVFGPPDRPMRVGRKTRFFTGALRRCIEVRDRWCTHPGCRIPAELCDIDHITPWEEGGRTSQENGRLLCGPHNRWAYDDIQRQRGRPPARRRTRRPRAPT